MRTFLFILIFLVIQKSALSAERDSARIIPKGTSMIYVSHVAFDSILKILQDHHFRFRAVLENRFIRTRQKLIKEGAVFERIQVRYADSTAQIIGTSLGWHLPIHYPGVLFRGIMAYQKAGGSVAFEEMNEIAMALHGTIRYE